jgi:hypothetical protein
MTKYYLAICVLIFCAIPCYGVEALDPNKPPISQQMARQLLYAALYGGAGKAVLEPIEAPLEPDFQLFEDLNPNPNVPAHIGTYAVNRWDGTIWNTAGRCTIVTSPAYRKLKKKILAEISVITDHIQGQKNMKPECDIE